MRDAQPRPDVVSLHAAVWKCVQTFAVRDDGFGVARRDEWRRRTRDVGVKVKELIGRLRREYDPMTHRVFACSAASARDGSAFNAS